MTTTRLDPAALRESVLGVLRRIAPEVSPNDVDPSKPLRDQIDLDSMDWLNFLVALRNTIGVDIPEADYAKLATLDDLLAYIGARV